MNRMKVYDVPHKALRNALSQLSLRAGNTNYANIAEVTALHTLGTDVFKLLNVHAEDENSVSLAELEARCPGASNHDVDDHEAIEETQHKLEQMLGEIYQGTINGGDVNDAGAEFYLALSEFHGRYLEHTAEEERVTQPLLWQYFTDEELAGHRGKIIARLPPETLLKWFKFALPAQNHVERVGFLGRIKQTAPAAFYNQTMAVAEGALGKDEFEALEAALNN